MTSAKNVAKRPRVVVAISAFRSDQPVIDLVRRILKEDWPVESVVIVDSMGSGGIERFVAGEGVRERVHYHNSPTNLGSAGNLRKRLELGAELGADFVLALNHDAVADRTTVEALIGYAHLDRIGALYPLRLRKGKRLYDLTGTSDFAFRAHGTAHVPESDLVEVWWSSSNGALYATAPLREHGLGPDSSFWMGWEDYLYGLRLRTYDYRQFIVTAARTVDEYEYRPVSIAGHRLTLADKPNWYFYYSIRNMILTNMYEAAHPVRALKTVLWVALMAGHVWKRKGFGERGFASAYLQGIVDGLRNQRGKWKYP